jgi:beta-glucosidase
MTTQPGTSLADVLAFKPDFFWGAATSAYQVEGAVAADGRLPSIWDTFSHTEGAIDGGDNGDVACDHYHRWDEDVALMRTLGLNAYRFSIAWPRVLPSGAGPVNEAGLDFYDRLVDGLLEAGIRPFVTLYHWDLPQAVQDAGGWPERDTAYRFADYAEVVAGRLGDRVTDWVPVNEPLCCAWIGHLEGRMAPGVRDLTAAIRTSHHLNLAHGLGVQAIRASTALPPLVGAVNNLSTCEPASQESADILAARRMDGHVNRWWLDPVTGRGYPADMIEVYGQEPPVQDGDMDVIAAPVDFLGLNYYFRQIVADDPGGPVPYARQVPVSGAQTTAMGWEIHPDGLEELLVRLADDYKASAIYVTENGAAFADEPGADGSFADPGRTAYLEGHLAACSRAAARGAPVDGYFAWSLLDNFEWSYGYGKRFGLIHVDYGTQARTIKASGHRYGEIIRSAR